MNERPPKTAFTPTEWKLVQQLDTPLKVQRFLNAMPYNWERNGGTLRSFREVQKVGEAHCLEAALLAAVVLEQHGYPSLLMSLESQDQLDHVIFLFQRRNLWGSIARSRDLGLHGRKPLFRNLRQLVWSYYEPYIDYTGRIIGYGMTDLVELGNYDWRFSSRNMWKVENHLREIPHVALDSSDRRYERALLRFKEFKRRHPKKLPAYFENKELWMV